ncbi:MAG: hypothetical protein IJ756_00670 [Paludibacteraceae bacterium]|nr:hypothetical protein [Paludibacteraceae bacterium]
MKRIVFIILLFPCLLHTYGQTIFDASLFLNTGNQQVLLPAIERVTSIVETSYLLEHKQTLDRFGKDGNDYFNKIPSVSINVEDGFVVASNVFSPWNIDGDFTQYSETYRPIVYSIDRVSLSDTVKTHIDTTKVKAQPLAEDLLFVRTHSEKGLQTDTVCGKKTGWLALVIYDAENEKPYNVQLVRRQIEIVKGEPTVIELPDNNKCCIGGMFITLDYTMVGTIGLKLCGVISSVNKKTATLQVPIIVKKPSKLNKLNKL